MMSSKTTQGVGMTSDRTRKRLIDELRVMGISNELVLSVISEIPRHIFVEEALASRAYENKALPIGYGQTISQPYIVARMTELLLDVETSHSKSGKVLEIGTGCGYQTLVLSRLFEKVVSIERITQLHRGARDRLYDLRVRNVDFILGDGFDGDVTKAPYDLIIAAAVSNEIPEGLLNQLNEGGRLVMPVLTDSRDNTQHLTVVDKDDGRINKQVLERVSFVPRQMGII